MNRIRFFRVKQAGLLSKYLEIHLQLPTIQVEFLIQLGAIYRNFTRVTEDINLEAGDLLRCHIEPKRYPQKIHWDEKILLENENFLVVDKPHGLPCQAGLDNRIENLIYLLGKHKKQNLFITHRLDIGTRGLVIVAKTKTFQVDFNRQLEQRQVRKIYEAITEGPCLDAGPLVHWMRPHARAPKILSRQPVESWKYCNLNILQHRLLVPSSNPHLATKRGINYYQLQLHTGRTHQIRSQLAFEQNPILGDSLYGGAPHQLPFEWHALQCSELEFCQNDQTYRFHLPSLRTDLPAELHKEHH